MAGNIPDLEATARAGTGKGAARTARREGLVPGVVYGGGSDPVAINLDFNKLLVRLRKGRFLATLFNLKVEGMDDVRVICRGVQRDVVKDLPLHVDFMRLRQTSKVNLFVNVNFINAETAPYAPAGGMLTVNRTEVELRVTANNIPESIDIDLSEAQIGDVITSDSVKWPEGAKPVIDREFTIAAISAPKIVSADDEDEAEGEAAPEEGGEE
ncbi:large subunit ribosomal protein L25 [Loktanella ponticola]|uniref:Large ribosomal subunit protein bL25 n=1 Tax=Yoonia ponticola TaxID=1524255 RepID=A0A7W9BNF9_9RHOB|nr:50S ribosomal protein L25/general stress protein Ctc [Yoonia ponticola]MBB5723748.1 large subunit ribosomal protein L25 [Yoonia ponticola]